MKLFSALIIVFCYFFSSAQSWLPIQHDTLLNKKHELIISGTADYASTSLHKSLTQKLFYGGEITDDIKEKSLKLHRGINRFGSDLNTEIEYRNFSVSLFNNPNWGFTVKAGYFSFINALYSKDLYELTFYGNNHYISDTAFLSGTKFSAYTFQKIGFGWLDKKSKSSVTLNVFNISNYSNAFIRKGEIYQSSEIDTLSVGFSGNASFIGSSAFINGLGFGIDADLRITVPTRNNKPVYYQFLAKNIGFASLNNPLNQYTGDSIFTFTGISYNDVINGSSFLDSNFSILDTFGVQKSQTRKTLFLPGYLQFSKLVDVNSTRKLQEFYGIRLFLASAYAPLVFAGVDYRININNSNTINLGLNSSYGGFSKFRFGFYSSMKIKNFNIGLASENIFGKNGQSFLFRLQCGF